MASKKKPTADIPRMPKMPKMPAANGGPPRKKKPGGMQVAPPDMMDGFDGGSPGMGMGMAMDPGQVVQEKLTEWVRMAVLPKNVSGLYYQLRQKSIDGEQFAHQWEAEEVEGLEADDLATLFYSQAIEDSQTANGVTRYGVYALRPDGQGVSRCFFRLADEEMSKGMDTEPGHLPEGHMAQAHRHSEVFARMLVGQTENVMRHYRDQNRELTVHAGNAIRLQVQVAEMFQRIQDRSMMRDIMLSRVNRKEKMKEKIVDYALSFMPDILSRVGIVPGALKDAINSAQSLDAILAGMSQEKMELVSMALENDEQRSVFVKAYASAKQRAAAAQARAAAEQARKAQKNANGGGAGYQPIAFQAADQVAQAQQQTQEVQQEPVEPSREADKVAQNSDAPLLRFLMDLDDDAFAAVAGRFTPDELKIVKDLRKQHKAKQAAATPAE